MAAGYRKARRLLEVGFDSLALHHLPSRAALEDEMLSREQLNDATNMAQLILNLVRQRKNEEDLHLLDYTAEKLFKLLLHVQKMP